MSSIRTSRALLSERACLQCQRRKTRCITGNAGRPCEYCAKSSKECVFPQRSSRTPLTRKNLEDAEARCKRLEELLEQQKRNLRNFEVTEQDTVALDSSNKASKHSSRRGSRVPLSGHAIRANDDSAASPYEWDETIVENGFIDITKPSRDGMASLGGNNEDTGYLGNTSGQALLEAISSAISPRVNPELHTAVNSNQTLLNRELTASQGSINFLTPRLSVASMQDQLASAYFELYNTSYPIVHERTFRARWANRNQLARGDSWYMLYFMVMAIGEWVGGFSNEQFSVYFDAARSRFCAESLERGDTNSLQAFLLMSNYLQKRDRPNTAYNFLGIAHRMAIGLGLHREPRLASEADTFSMHRRRILFWVLYCFDGGFSITTGRPIFLSDSFIDVCVPQNVDDSEHESLMDRPTEVARPTNCSALIAQARLAKVANKMYHELMGVSICTDVERQTSILEHMLQDWRSSLPYYFFSDDVPRWFICPRAVVLWKEVNVRILLLLASQRQRTDLYDKFSVGQRYRSAAADTLIDICQFCLQTKAPLHLGVSWYAVYFILQSVLALSIHELAKATTSGLLFRQKLDGHRQTYASLIQQAQQTLGMLAQHDQVAARALPMLNRLRNDVQQSRGNKEAMINEPSHIRRNHDPSAMSVDRDAGPTVASQENGLNQDLEFTDLEFSSQTHDEQLIPNFYDAMDTSFQMFEREDLLADIFQDCYGPLH